MAAFKDRATERAVEEEDAKLGVASNKLGLFADVDDGGEEVVDEKRERGIERDMLGVALKVHRFRIRPLTLSAFALLRQIDSAFLTFTPILSNEDRDDLLALAELQRRSKEEEVRYMKLIAMAKAESEMIKNPYLETLRFMALMHEDVSEEEAEDLAFAGDDGRALRRAALHFGEDKQIEANEMDELTTAIGMAVGEAQQAKVVPAKKKGPRHTAPKKKEMRSRRLSSHR